MNEVNENESQSQNSLTERLNFTASNTEKGRETRGNEIRKYIRKSYAYNLYGLFMFISFFMYAFPNSTHTSADAGTGVYSL